MIWQCILPTLYSFYLSQATYTLITSVYQFIFLFNSFPTRCQCSQHLYCILYIFTLSLLSFYLFFIELTCYCSSDIQSTLIHLFHLLVFNTLNLNSKLSTHWRNGIRILFLKETETLLPHNWPNVYFSLCRFILLSHVSCHQLMSTQYSYQVGYFKARSVFCYDTLQTDVLI